MELNKQLQDVSDTVTDKSVKVTVDIPARSRLHGILQKWKLVPVKRDFFVRGITMGNLLRISDRLNDLGISPDLKELTELTNDKIKNYAPVLIDIVAIGLHNDKTEPPESLVEFVENKMTANDVLGVLTEILKKMNVQGFITSIILILGINILKMSRDDQGSSIAPGTPSEVV